VSEHCLPSTQLITKVGHRWTFAQVVIDNSSDR